MIGNLDTFKNLDTTKAVSTIDWAGTGYTSNS